MLELRGARNQPWSVSVRFVAGDATKDIKAAIGAGKQLVITYLAVEVTTLAAQVVRIVDEDDTLDLQVLPASAPLGHYQGLNMEVGVPLPANKKLIYKPAAAGVAGCVHAEGYVLGV